MRSTSLLFDGIKEIIEPQMLSKLSEYPLKVIFGFFDIDFKYSASPLHHKYLKKYLSD